MVYRAGFSSDGKRILTASFDKTSRLWNVKSGELIRIFVGHRDSLNTAVFSPDGSHILTASNDNTARLWDVGADCKPARAAVPRCLTRLERSAAWIGRDCRRVHVAKSRVIGRLTLTARGSPSASLTSLIGTPNPVFAVAHTRARPSHSMERRDDETPHATCGYCGRPAGPP